MKSNVPEALEILADAVLNPRFTNWEVADQIVKMEHDIKGLKENPQTVLLEVRLHRPSKVSKYNLYNMQLYCITHNYIGLHIYGQHGDCSPHMNEACFGLEQACRVELCDCTCSARFVSAAYLEMLADCGCSCNLPRCN